MSAKKAKVTNEQCETSSCGDTIEDLQATVSDLADLAVSFTDEIQNIMTTENLSFSYRSSLLGTATKNFVSEVKRIGG